MDSVKVSKNDLLHVLKENLDKHKIAFDQAMKKRHRAALTKIQEIADKMTNEDSFVIEEKLNFPRPTNNSNEYEKAIKMVSMSVDVEIVLNDHQFDQLVMDNWHWKMDFFK